MSRQSPNGCLIVGAVLAEDEQHGDRQMTHQDTPPIEAKSKQGLGPVYVLVPATALLAWVAQSIWQSQDVSDIKGRGRALAGFPPEVVVAFFAITALICLACVALALRRYLWPRTELVMDANGVTSHLFWGRGTLRWDEITKLARQEGWLHVHGRSAPSGKPKKLIVAIDQLDHPADQILAHMGHYRPDLFG